MFSISCYNACQTLNSFIWSITVTPALSFFILSANKYSQQQSKWLVTPGTQSTRLPAVLRPAPHLSGYIWQTDALRLKESLSECVWPAHFSHNFSPVDGFLLALSLFECVRNISVFTALTLSGTSRSAAPLRIFHPAGAALIYILLFEAGTSLEYRRHALCF